MPNWGEVLNEINGTVVEHPVDTVRKKYLKVYEKYTNRNVIAYYSGFLQKPPTNGVAINDTDKNAFMQAVNKLDREKGLDLILHTPGGDIAATVSLVTYLRSIFGDDIRAIVPQIAMSAGTMIALSCKEIVMGKESSLGPIDPQFGGLSCQGVLDEFDAAIESVTKNPSTGVIWQSIIGKYHPTFLGDCKNAIKWADEEVTKWLCSNMLKDDHKKAEEIVKKLSSHSETKNHARHIDIDECEQLGLKIKRLESYEKKEIDGCQDFQDCVLTLHHAYMHTFSITDNLKIVENQINSAMILHGGGQ